MFLLYCSRSCCGTVAYAGMKLITILHRLFLKIADDEHYLYYMAD